MFSLYKLQSIATSHSHHWSWMKQRTCLSPTLKFRYFFFSPIMNTYQRKEKKISIMKGTEKSEMHWEGGKNGVSYSNEATCNGGDSCSGCLVSHGRFSILFLTQTISKICCRIAFFKVWDQHTMHFGYYSWGKWQMALKLGRLGQTWQDGWKRWERE